MVDRLSRAVRRVERNGNCSGCGGCTLISSRVEMALDDEGYMRPRVSGAPGAQDTAESRRFSRVCPGVRVDAPPQQAATHPVLGTYVSAWQGTAVDEEVRFAGSSGGVLTALSTWLVETGRARTVAGACAAADAPRLTVPVSITTREEAMRASGSRYAPVAALDGWSGEAADAISVKPCEASAARAYHQQTSPGAEAPLMLSFFCAGTPSQHATDQLADTLIGQHSQLRTLRYRGEGWPGEFRVESADGEVGTLSYADSWGAHLGRQLQWRCKICVDGTGASADIAVGDYWEADAEGFPVFDEGAGNSVVIARTQRGDEILRLASEAGVIAIAPLDIQRAIDVQPLQYQRRTALIGRLWGRRLAGRRVPSYRGYGLYALAVRHAGANARSLVGTWLRTMKLR